MHPKEVLTWLNSLEFKQKYLDTDHPYPPLLNPTLLNGEGSFENDGLANSKGKGDTGRADGLANSKGEGKSLANLGNKNETLSGGKAEALENSSKQGEACFEGEVSKDEALSGGKAEAVVNSKGEGEGFAKAETQPSKENGALATNTTQSNKEVSNLAHKQNEALSNSSKQDEAVGDNKAEALTNSNSKNEQALTKNSSTNSLKTQASSKDEIQARSNTQAFSKDEIQAALKTQALSKSEPQILSNDKSKYKNPDLSYEKIPASLAWQLNLPLPKKYKLILATLSYSAHTSMVSYLLKCKLAISMHHSIDSKTNYIFNYEHILKETPLVINITGYMYSNLRFSQLHKLISLLNNKTTVLWLLRCPMQRLLSILKFCNRKPNLNYNLNEDTPLNILENRRIHGVDISKPLDERIKIATQTNSFAYIKLLGYFKSLGFKNWDFLDLSGIKDQQKILELFVKLSKTYSFETPKNKDDFSYEFIALHNGIIPLNFTVKGYKFKLHNQLLNELEISEALELKKTKLTSRIFIYAPDKNWQELDQSYLRKKIQALYDKLNEVLEDEASKAVSKEELMNLLRADTQTRRLLKEVFDKEVGFVKECAPEMVASWDYYNEFERICKELDGA